MGQTIRKCRPATGELVAEVACTDVLAVPAMVARAREAQIAWAALPVRERGRAIARVAEVVVAEAETLAQGVADETGKPLLEAVLHEVFGVALLARYFGSRAHKILKPRRISAFLLKHRQSYIHYAPRGVVGVISPWNFPLTLAFGDCLMALCAGNAVVLKPSEHTPLSGLAIRRCIAAAGIDPELLQVAVGYGDVGAALVRGGVDMVHFTGSAATGRKIAATCGELLIPCVLELGGKDAAIVLEDADLEHAARTLVFGAFLNAGQACASVERVYAVGDVYEPLVARVVTLVRSLRQGDANRDEVDVGPMIVPMQREIVQRHVDEARARGATVRVGGAANGPYYQPTVLTEVDDAMAICREETFGPVMPIMQVRDVEEAVRRANASPYGLSAYVFTRNVARGREVAERLRAGTVDINDVLFTQAAPETPWGGLKTSGIGYTHSDEGLRHLCEARHVNYSPWPIFANPWLFPYRRALVTPCLEIIRGLLGGESLLRRCGRMLRGLKGAWQVLRAPK